MKKSLVAALAGTAALLAATAANAVTFTYIGNLASFTAQTSGYYKIDAWGAQGGSPALTTLGGLGAMVGGSLHLDAGETLSILVGGQGGGDISGNTANGGGGGTFVFTSLPTSGPELLLAAGGGGGAGWYAGAGGPGLAGRDGGGAGGGVNGLGGAAAGDRNGAAGGGAGWLGAGASGTTGIYGEGGLIGRGGWTRGCIDVGQMLECETGPSGGFGGGGGGSYNDGGGGGGYSGGGGGSFGTQGGGGGGSYIADEFSHTLAQSGVRSGNGLVTIDLIPLSVPEPATWAMMLVGFFGLGSLLRRRRGGAEFPAA
ncbi:MAG: PEPxxWA-CTERM sorting domain-containing protein [Caulobacteraceae bacterium]